MERRTRKRRKGLSSFPIQAVRSVTDVVRSHQGLRPVIYGHSVMSLKLREIQMVLKWPLPARKSLKL
jgi:hypothetical protein